VAMNIRMFVSRTARLTDLVELGSLTGHAARSLEAAVLTGLNIVVAGGTQAGTTTMLHCRRHHCHSACDGVVSAEESLELCIPHRLLRRTRSASIWAR